MAKYGVPSPMQCGEVKEKLHASMIEKYGVANPMQSAEIQAKAAATNVERYGSHTPMHSEEVVNKIKRKMVEKYGVENAFASEEIKQKIRQTNLEKYGSENPMQTPEVQAKLEATSMARYGTRRPTENADIRAKVQQTHANKTRDEIQHMLDKTVETSLQRYGTQSPNQAPIVKQRKIKSSLEKYGTEHPMQDASIQAKIQRRAFCHKDFTMPSGAIRKVQGYEPFALKLLLDTYTEEQIITDRPAIPRFQYTANNKQRYYFPDIYIPHVNKIIEVKSTWTYKCTTDNITHKAAACKEAGYDYEIWVFDGKGNRVDVPSPA